MRPPMCLKFVALLFTETFREPIVYFRPPPFICMFGWVKFPKLVPETLFSYISAKLRTFGIPFASISMFRKMFGFSNYEERESSKVGPTFLKTAGFTTFLMEDIDIFSGLLAACEGKVEFLIGFLFAVGGLRLI